jgi:GT2 family glycosyltransferase
MPERSDRQFAAKAHAFNAGLEELRETAYDVVGNLDADITFESDYFEFLLGQFEGDPRLGVVGTPFVENEERKDDHTLRASVRATRTRLRRLPALPQGMLRADRRIHPHQRRRD